MQKRKKKRQWSKKHFFLTFFHFISFIETGLLTACGRTAPETTVAVSETTIYSSASSSFPEHPPNTGSSEYYLSSDNYTDGRKMSTLLTPLQYNLLHINSSIVFVYFFLFPFLIIYQRTTFSKLKETHSSVVTKICPSCTSYHAETAQEIKRCRRSPTSYMMLSWSQHHRL